MECQKLRGFFRLWQEPEKRIEEERRSVREALAAAKQTKRNVRVKAVGGNQTEQLFR